MIKYNFISSMAIISFMFLKGCSTSGDYRCESNDLCSSTSEWKYYSCSIETGHCEKVDPLAIDPLTLPDATIGQSDYRVELSATGGIATYNFSLTREDEGKLKWLTLTQEGENKAILHNSTDTNNEAVVPTDLNDGIPLSINITLRDNSKHGIADREDNQGKPFTMSIKIKDCSRTNCDNGDSTTTLVGTSRCSDGRVKICNQNSLGCAAWGEEDNCSTNSCQTAGSYKNISCCNDQNRCGSSNDSRCNVATNWMEKCGYDATGCLVWQQDNQCSGKGCKSDGSNCIDCVDTCTPEGAHQCNSDNTSVNICKKNLDECLEWTLYEQCTDDPNSHCLPFGSQGCNNGRCNIRYLIQDNGLEVLDKTTNLIWKHQIEPNIANPDTYTWDTANSQCSLPYHLPTIAELETIIETGHGSLYINNCAFTSMPTGDNFPYSWFWSSSSSDVDPNIAKGVDFVNGRVNSLGKTSSVYVRCVRGGP